MTTARRTVSLGAAEAEEHSMVCIGVQRCETQVVGYLKNLSGECSYFEELQGSLEELTVAILDNFCPKIADLLLALSALILLQFLDFEILEIT